MLQNKKVWVSGKWEIGCREEKEAVSVENENEVVVKNHYTHLSAGTELACVAGLEGWFNFPASPGYTGIGEVIETGSAVDHVQKGDLVYTYSTHSRYFKLDVTDRWHGVCVKLPPAIDPEIASFTHMAGIAMTAIRKSRIEIGDDVLVAGQGVIGNLAAQLAVLQGADVIVTDVEERRLDVSRRCGLSHRVNTQKEDLEVTVSQFTGGRGVSTLIDATGMAPVVNEYADYVSLNGEIILLGSPRKPFETNLTDFLGHFHYIPYNHNLKGALEFTIPTHQNDFCKHSIERNAEIIMNLIVDEKLVITPFYSHKVFPDEAEKVYKGLRDQPGEYMGVVFDWT